jgi:hypothetical protein
MMQAVYFTLIDIGLYFFSDWLLDRIERARGERFANRQLLFLESSFLLAPFPFQLIDWLGGPNG